MLVWERRTIVRRTEGRGGLFCEDWYVSTATFLHLHRR